MKFKLRYDPTYTYKSDLKAYTPAYHMYKKVRVGWKWCGAFATQEQAHAAAVLIQEVEGVEFTVGDA